MESVRCIKDLKPEIEECALKCRVTRIWDAVNTKANNDFISLDLILIDEKGDQIHAVIKKVHATHFRPLIQEGKIYVISNFKVLLNRLSFRPVHNNYMISFYAITSIKEIKNDIIGIQRHQFEFLDFHDVPKRLNNDLHLTGELQLNTTSATKIYVDLDILEAERLRSKFENETIAVEKKNLRTVSTTDSNDQATKNRITISKLLGIRWNENKQENIYTCLASIEEVLSKFGWFYTSCYSCRKKLHNIGSKLWCNNCNMDIEFPVLRYKLHLLVKDESGSATFVVFDREAEKLTKDMVNSVIVSSSKESNDNSIPKAIKMVEGKSYVFQIRLSDFNLKDASQTFTVSKIFENDVNSLNLHPAKDKKLLTENEDKGKGL
ncbi:uncharacterized protein LOC109706160 isoform X2 [Ananas comosus]|uniref:Uncharacterized protein LOC109706160 isoform X2 n=1 Tax=Ananas comosus TaxID=4615 RepID=A0A6P5EMG6_ANACO|nr:uncharacterized protein LOC109706160 isoform X2 [Ananas comosus]